MQKPVTNLLPSSFATPTTEGIGSSKRVDLRALSVLHLLSSHRNVFRYLTLVSGRVNTVFGPWTRVRPRQGFNGYAGLRTETQHHCLGAGLHT